MSVEMNESYNRCLQELRARYKDRGISGSIKKQNANVAQTKSIEASSENYVLFDSRSKIADSYRSGVYNGSKYMTSDDFVRYFKSRREFNMPEALRKQQEAEAKAGALAQKRQSGRGLREGRSDSKEGHLKTIISALVELKNKWFPMEPMAGRVNRERFRVPVAALSGLAIFTVSLGLIVGGSVMIGEASGELGRANSEISLLEAREADLEGKLDLKYSINEIEEDAKSLGMIKREHADNEYLPIEGDDEVIIYDENQDKNVGLAALLAAFGIDVN
ncbi:MAG: hypothetical protein E7577_02390 [Ruminococcaceae bacterium]|nr:hypothetical protein [Oscillospiraceae bacterium]